MEGPHTSQVPPFVRSLSTKLLLSDKIILSLQAEHQRQLHLDSSGATVLTSRLKTAKSLNGSYCSGIARGRKRTDHRHITHIAFSIDRELYHHATLHFLFCRIFGVTDIFRNIHHQSGFTTGISSRMLHCRIVGQIILRHSNRSRHRTYVQVSSHYALGAA